MIPNLDPLIDIIKEETGFDSSYDYLIMDKYPLWHPDSVGIREFMESKSVHIARSNIFCPNSPREISTEEESQLVNNVREYLELSRKLSWGDSVGGNALAGPPESDHVDANLKKLFSPDEIKKIGLLWYATLQGNVRGLPIDAGVQEYRDQFDIFSTDEHSLDENRLFVLSSQFNCGNDWLPGVAPILLDPDFKERNKGDTNVLANLYAGKVIREYLSDRTGNSGAQNNQLYFLLDEFKSLYGPGVGLGPLSDVNTVKQRWQLEEER